MFIPAFGLIKFADFEAIFTLSYLPQSKLMSNYWKTKEDLSLSTNERGEMLWTFDRPIHLATTIYLPTSVFSSFSLCGYKSQHSMAEMQQAEQRCCVIIILDFWKKSYAAADYWESLSLHTLVGIACVGWGPAMHCIALGRVEGQGEYWSTTYSS